MLYFYIGNVNPFEKYGKWDQNFGIFFKKKINDKKWNWNVIVSNRYLDNTEYYLDNVERIAADDFELTERDIVLWVCWLVGTDNNNWRACVCVCVCVLCVCVGRACERQVSLQQRLSRMSGITRNPQQLLFVARAHIARSLSSLSL